MTTQHQPKSVAAPAAPTAAPPQPVQVIIQQPAATPATRSHAVAIILSLLFGGLGIDRFYLGHVGIGLGKFFTFGGLGVWWLIDFILIIAKGTKALKAVPWG